MASRPKSLSPPRARAYASSIEQRAAECRFEDRSRLRRRLPDVAGDEVRAIGLDEMALRHQSEGAQDLAEQAGDGRLAGPGVAREHEVVAGLQRRQLALGAQLLDAQQAGQATDIGLHGVEADEVVELGEQLFDRARRRAARPVPSATGDAAVAELAATAVRRCLAAPRGEQRRRRRRRRAARRGSGRWRRSRRVTARGRRPPRHGRGASPPRSSGSLDSRPSRASALTSRSNSVLGRSSHDRLPCSIPPSRSRSGVMITGGSSRGPMSSTQARSSSPDNLPSLSNTAAASSPASIVTSPRWSSPARACELGGHPVDERIDVLAEDPGHARHRTRTPPPPTDGCFPDGTVMKHPSVGHSGRGLTATGR